MKEARKLFAGFGARSAIASQNLISFFKSLRDFLQRLALAGRVALARGRAAGSRGMGVLKALWTGLGASFRSGVYSIARGLARFKRAAVCFLLSPKTIISGIIAASMVAMSITAVQGYHAGFGTVVFVDQQEIGFIYTEELAELEAYAETLLATARDNYQLEVHQNETISFEEDRRPGAHVELEVIKDELQQRLSFSAVAYRVLVDGEEMMILASMAEYEELLEIIGSAYMSERKNARVLSVEIQENIECQPCLVEPEDIMDLETAANLLLMGTERQETYLVSRGDSLWTIARAHSISLGELREANPQITGTMIHPGDKINLVVAEPLVNVAVVEEIKVTERIPFKTNFTTDSKLWQYQTRVVTRGSSGEKTVTYKVVMENGREVERVKMEEKITREPVTQVVARGTANVPALGTGRFAWPMASGAGRISSPYGWRWGRMHTGIDIAAPSGTAIRAADSGVVAFSGYRSSYGNLIILEHGNGYSTYYAHNSKNLVSQGQKVNKGETIALVGRTGNATGAHLHFEIRYNGKHMDPMKFYRP